MRITPALAALTLGLALAACGSDDAADTDVTVSATEHNDADVSFATDMIQHHAQALAMVDMTVGRDLDPDVTTLAEDIRAAQGPEIELMVDWLNDWNEPVPETVRDHVNAGHGDDGEMGHEGMDHGDMPGMMSAEDMDTLEQAPADEFQDMWLGMMIEHHEGAVEMAQEEVGEGRFQDAVELAGDIVESQTSEIEELEALQS
jgi:uncharacterized protein (DUF305 family)